MELQSAIEYLTSYGWMLLIVAALLSALYALGVFSAQKSGGSQCIIQNGLSCTNFVMNTSGFLKITIMQTGAAGIYVLGIGCSQNASDVILQSPSQTYNPINKVFSHSAMLQVQRRCIFRFAGGAILKGP